MPLQSERFNWAMDDRLRRVYQQHCCEVKFLFLDSVSLSSGTQWYIQDVYHELDLFK